MLSVAVALVAAMAWLLTYDSQLRGGALEDALQHLVTPDGSDASVVAQAILENHRETRLIAALWSGLYWGFAWTSAIFGALAGLILKLESLFDNEKRRKDVAAFLTMTAALLVTISTGGDFQRKWQANRIASAEIERLGYGFLEHKGENARSYLAELSSALYKRHMAILGGDQQSSRRQPSGSESAVKP
jgi:hypothetical protein